MSLSDVDSQKFEQIAKDAIVRAEREFNHLSPEAFAEGMKIIYDAIENRVIEADEDAGVT